MKNIFIYILNVSSCSCVHLFPTTINSLGVAAEVGDLKNGDNWEGDEMNGVKEGVEEDKLALGDRGLIDGEITI